jgi:hypothetical protein
MLRESFYRTCERYLSGAITKPQLVVQAARDQRSMVTVLAIEQLTGVARGQSTIISPGGTAASVISGGDAAKLVRDYDERLQKAKATRMEADKAVVAAAKKECSTESDNKEANEGICTSLKLAASDAAAKETEAQTAMDKITAIAKDLISAASASTTAGQSMQGGGAKNDAIRAVAVSNAVVQIVKLSSINEPLMFCLGFMGDSQSLAADKEQKVTTGCMRILSAQAQADLKSRNAAGLDFNFIQGSIDAAQTDAILQSLNEKIEAVIDEKDLPGLIEKYEQRAGLKEKGISIAGYCKNKEQCIYSARKTYSSFISLNIKKATEALDVFSQEESEQ